MNSSDENIKNKIIKLFALANDKGASEDEAATAMRMAMGLMAKHGIDQSTLGNEIPRAKKGSRVSARFEQYQIILAGAAAHLYGCRIIMYDGGRAGLVFVGRPDNIDAGELTLFFLAKQLEALYKQSLPKGLTQRQRSDYRKSFKWACAQRVNNRVWALVRYMQSSDTAALNATGSKALVVKGHFDQMFAEADAQMSDVTPGDLKPKFGSGTNAGFTAGDRVKLREELK